MDNASLILPHHCSRRCPSGNSRLVTCVIQNDVEGKKITVSSVCPFILEVLFFSFIILFRSWTIRPYTISGYIDMVLVQA